MKKTAGNTHKKQPPLDVQKNNQQESKQKESNNPSTDIPKKK